MMYFKALVIFIAFKTFANGETIVEGKVEDNGFITEITGYKPIQTLQQALEVMEKSNDVPKPTGEVKAPSENTKPAALSPFALDSPDTEEIVNKEPSVQIHIQEAPATLPRLAVDIPDNEEVDKKEPFAQMDIKEAPATLPHLALDTPDTKVVNKKEPSTQIDIAKVLMAISPETLQVTVPLTDPKINAALTHILQTMSDGGVFNNLATSNTILNAPQPVIEHLPIFKHIDVLQTILSQNGSGNSPLTTNSQT